MTATADEKARTAPAARRLVAAVFASIAFSACTEDGDRTRATLRELCDNEASELGADVWVLQQLGVAPDWLEVRRRNPDTPWELRKIHSAVASAVDPKADGAAARTIAKRACYEYFKP